MNTQDYDYQPTQEDIDKFNALWLQIWEPQCHFLPSYQYNFFRNFAFDNFLLGINQHRKDIVLDLERTLRQ